MTDNTFYNKYYGQLVGAKIVGFNLIEDDFGGDPFPEFTLQLGRQKVKFTLSSDEEGNGAGFAFIEETA
jgi:hypothetical protein